MNAGKRNKSIALLKVSLVKDDSGQPRRKAAEIARVWSAWTKKSHQDGAQNERRQYRTRHIVNIPFRKDLCRGDQIMWQGLTYDIRDIEPDSRRRFIDLEVSINEPGI